MAAPPKSDPPFPHSPPPAPRRAAPPRPARSWLGANLLRTSSLPHSLSALTGLKKLWLPSNHLVELPEAVCDLPALEWL
jgi:Leucine-rich repeat (LRR) protein